MSTAATAVMTINSIQAKELSRFRANVALHASDDQTVRAVAYRPYQGPQSVTVAADGTVRQSARPGGSLLGMVDAWALGALGALASRVREFQVVAQDGRLLAHSDQGDLVELNARR